MRAQRLRFLACAVLSVLALGSCAKKSNTSTENASFHQPLAVSHIDIGRGLGADKRITDATSSFKPNDTIYAAVFTTGSAQNSELRARWTYEDGQVVNETQEMIAPQGNATTEFHISKPDGWPPGQYTLEVFLNGTSVGTKKFEVKRS